LDIVNFKIATGVYSHRIAYIEEVKKNGLEHENNPYDYYKSADALKEKPKAKVSFEKVFEDLVKLYANCKSNFGLPKEILLIKEEKPLVYEAYHNLGVDRVRELKYHVSNIKAELIKTSDIPQARKIKELILEKIGYGIHEDALIKRNIQAIYTILDIAKNAKSTVVSEYFLTKPHIIKGKRCTELIKEKTVYELPETDEPQIESYVTDR